MSKTSYYAPVTKVDKSPAGKVARSANLTVPNSFSKKQEDNEWDIVTLVNETNPDVDGFTRTLGNSDKNFPVPGICSVSVENVYSYNIERLKKSEKFPAIVSAGLDLRKVRIEVLISTEDEFNKMVDLLNVLIEKDVGSSLYRIQHPIVSINKIDSCFIESISTPQPNARDGWTVTMNFIEYSDSAEKKTEGKKRTSFKDSAVAQTQSKSPGR